MPNSCLANVSPSLSNPFLRFHFITAVIYRQAAQFLWFADTVLLVKQSFLWYNLLKYGKALQKRSFSVPYFPFDIFKEGFSLTEEEIRRKLSKIRCFMLDMDGTFYLGNRLLDGSLSFLDRLRETGRTNLFLTNNSSKSASVYVDKLRRMGVDAEFCNVLTSGQAAGSWCLRNMAGKKAFLLGNDMLRRELESMGLSFDQTHPDYVLIGYDTTLDYAKMTAVCDFVRAGLPYIATHPDYNCPTESGFAPDIGAIMSFIHASTGKNPDLVIGKPNSGIVEEALKKTGLAPEELAMVGDRLYTDIATGRNFGILSILVLTGEASMDDVNISDVKPDLIFERLSSMNHLL